MSDKDYVLGTHDAEVDRLALQHVVWRSQVLDVWNRAGFRRGMSVLDVGAGPGYATTDLADVVGPNGKVFALERSQRFLEVLRARVSAQGKSQVQSFERDLVTEEWNVPQQVDRLWCRWVLSFVGDVDTVVAKMAKALRKGGSVVLHEYINYETLSLMPPNQAFNTFTHKVMESWRANGGEPNIAQVLIPKLVKAGFRIDSLRPLVQAVTPESPVWAWPRSFIDVNVDRMMDIGHLTAQQAADTKRSMDDAEAAPTGSVFMVTPTVLEIVATLV